MLSTEASLNRGFLFFENTNICIFLILYENPEIINYFPRYAPKRFLGSTEIGPLIFY